MQTTAAKPIDPQYNSCVKENYSINYSVTDWTLEERILETGDDTFPEP